MDQQKEIPRMRPMLLYTPAVFHFQIIQEGLEPFVFDVFPESLMERRGIELLMRQRERKEAPPNSETQHQKNSAPPHHDCNQGRNRPRSTTPGVTPV